MSRRTAALVLLLLLVAPARAATRWLTDRAGAPIRWQDWNAATLARAKNEKRPLFVSIAQASSYRGYRMHREAFLNGEIAETMNTYFVPVLLDPIEHPEIAEAYAIAARALGVQNTPPLNVILTTDLEPFAAGGAMTPDELNRMLVVNANRWASERAVVAAEGQANLAKARELGEKRTPGDIDATTLERVVDDIGRKYGAGTMLDATSVSFLFDYAARTKHENIRGVAEQTLRNLAILPIRDQLGGGFHHSVTTYEKLLTDQALLALAYLDAWQLTKDPSMAYVARTTLDYVIRDLTPQQRGAFDAAQDAMSLVPRQGPEFINGAFYAWTSEEVVHLLGADEGRKIVSIFGIPNRLELKEYRVLAETYGPLAAALAKLLDVRQRRPEPFRESTIVAGWNGLMISALARAAAAFDEPRYLVAATAAANAVTTKLWKNRSLQRTDGGAPALAEDYAFLISGLLDLFDSGYDPKWLDLAIALQQRQDALFWDASAGRYATGATLPDALRGLLVESDEGTPAASSVSAINLLRLAMLTGNETWRARPATILQSFGAKLRTHGAQLPRLASAYELSRLTPSIVVVTGDWRTKETQDALRAAREGREPMRAVIFLPPKGAQRERLLRLLPFVGALTSDPERTLTYRCANGECTR